LLDVPLLDWSLLYVLLLDRALPHALLLYASLTDVLLADFALLDALLLYFRLPDLGRPNVPLANVARVGVRLPNRLWFDGCLLGLAIAMEAKVAIPPCAPIARFEIVAVAPCAAVFIARFEAAVTMRAGRFAVVPVLNLATRLFVAVPVQVILGGSLAQEGAQAAVMAWSCLRGARG